MSNFAERFKAAREHAGISQRALGRRIGYSGSAISQWEAGVIEADNIRVAALEMAAGIMGVSVRYLRTGKEDDSRGEVPGGLRAAQPDVRQLPVISMVQAGHGREAADPYPRGYAEQSVSVDAELAQDLGRLAFALEITGESMLEEFHPGDIVIIDPAVKPLPGDFVVARIESDGSATFKKYRSRGRDAEGHEIFELVPLNADYPTVVVNAANPGSIIGTMMEHRRRRRRH